MDRLSNLKNEKMAINNTDSRTTVPVNTGLMRTYKIKLSCESGAVIVCQLCIQYEKYSSIFVHRQKMTNNILLEPKLLTHWNKVYSCLFCLYMISLSLGVLGFRNRRKINCPLSSLYVICDRLPKRNLHALWNAFDFKWFMGSWETGTQRKKHLGFF